MKKTIDTNHQVTVYGRLLISSSELSSALQLVKHSIGSSSVVPQHGCVKLKFGISELEVMANDFRSKTRVVLTGDTIDGMASGEIWLGPVFINFISLLAEQPLELKLTKRSSEIQTDYWSFLNVITTDSLYEFASPIGWGDYEDEVATGNSDEICTLPTEQLLEALYFVMPALASYKDEFAGAKASICMNVSKLKYIITTTDGLKVNRYSEKHNSQTIKNGEYLIDQKAVKLISAFLKRTRYDEVKFLAMDSFMFSW